MPHGDLIHLHDPVGVAVVSYKRPCPQTKADGLANAHKVRQMIEGMKLGLPDLGLVIFPRHSIQGMPGDADVMAVLAVLAQACRNAKVWAVFAMNVDEPACTTLVLMNDQGEIVHQHRDGLDGMKISIAIGHHDANAMLAVRCQGGRTLVDFNGVPLGECGEDRYGIHHIALGAQGPITNASGDPRSRPRGPRPDAAPPPARP